MILFNFKSFEIILISVTRPTPLNRAQNSSTARFCPISDPPASDSSLFGAKTCKQIKNQTALRRV